MKKTCKRLKKLNKKGIRIGQIFSNIQNIKGKDLYYISDKDVKDMIKHIYKHMEIK